MRPYFNLITIGYDSDQSLSLRRAITSINRSGDAFIAWSSLDPAHLSCPEFVPALLDSADAIVCSGLTDARKAAVLAQLLVHRPDVPVIPVACTPDVVLLCARWGSLCDPVPTASRNMCPLALVLSALGQPSPFNLETALRLLVWQLRPGSIAEPALPLTYPAVGFWYPDRGCSDDWRTFSQTIARRYAAAPTGSRILLLCQRAQVIAGNDAHLRAAISALEAFGLEVVPLFCGEHTHSHADFIAGILAADLVVDAAGLPLALQFGGGLPVVVARRHGITGTIVPDQALVERVAREICRALAIRRRPGAGKVVAFPNASGQ